MTEKETFTRLIQLYAMNAGIDPDIAVRVARQESGINQQAVSPKGALGIMQLMPDTARSLRVDPHDPAENIRGGVKYLKQQQDRFGSTEKMLAAYNAGPGAVEKYGGVPPYKETRNYVQRIMGFLGPGSAEAATGTAPAPGTRPAVKAAKRLSPEERAALEARLAELEAAEGQERAALEARLAELEAARDREEGPAAPPPQPSPPPSPPGAPAPEPLPPLAEQEEAATQQALGGTLGYEVDVVGSGPPGTFGRPAPGGTVQLEPPETPPMARPPGVLPPGVPRPAAEPGPVAVQTTPEGRIDYEAYLPSPGKEAAKRAAAELINITSVGQGARLGLWAGSRFGPIPAAVGAGLGAVTGAVLSRTANVATGLEEPGLLGDVLSIAPPAGQAVWGAGKAGLRGIVKRSRGWKVVEKADEATKAQRQAAITQEQAREAAYQSRVQTQQQRAATTHQAKEVQRAQAVAEQSAEATQEAAAKTQQQASDYAAQVQRYNQAVASQRQAVGEARAIPARYKPDTPAHVLYKKVAEIAPEAPVTLARTQEVAAELQDVLGQVPSLQPSRLQALLTDMRAARSTQSVKEVQRYLTDLGTLTRSNDSATRRTAKQLYGALHDDLAESATRLPETEAARDLLLAANASFRRELATRDLARIIRRSSRVGDDGIRRLRPGKLLNSFDDLVEEDRFFAGSFTPEELTALRDSFDTLTAVQKIPTRPGAAPAPVSPKVVDPYTPTPFVPPQPPPRPAPYSRWQKDVEPEFTFSKETSAQVARSIAGLGMADFALGLPGPLTTLGGAALAQQGMAELMAALVISPKTRPAMKYLLNLDGSINKKALVAMAGGRAALLAERKKAQEKGKR